MLIVSDALKQAFMEPERTIYVRIKIGNRVFDNDDVVSIEYDSGSLSGEVFAVGSTYSNSIKVTFSDLVEGLKELDKVIYEIGIKLPDGTIGYVPMGTFIINEAIEMDRNNNKTIIECMDRMVMMGGAYVSSLTYPAPIREVALEIANKAGVTVDVTSFERLSADKIAKPEGYTLREAIGLVAQFEAGFATFNRFGKLEIRTLSDPMFAVPPDNYFSKGLVKNEVFFRLGGISCTTDDGDTVIQSGNSAGNQVVLENRAMTKPLLDKIYQKIQTINYYPFSLNWQGNPVLEAGDWIEVEDLQGNKFKTPNLNYSLSFSGGLSAKSSADTTTQSDVTYQYKSPLQQKIEWIQARIDAAGGNVVYEGIDEPANPKEGDLWFKIIGPDKEILVYKKDKDGNLFWDSQISTADINKVAKEIEKIIAQADADRVAAEKNFEQAVVDAATYTNTKAQEFDNKLVSVNQEVANVTQAANAAISKADQAVQDVGFMQIDVTSAKTNATTALENANTAKANASTALTNASSALTKVGALEVTTGSLQTSYNELTKTVGLKADKTTVDGINSKVTQHGLDISANATALGLKADKSVVDSIKGTVDKHTLDIKAAADGLTLKADSSLVNTIKGTVDTHTTQISANSTAINARLTSAQVETLLTGKKYVNETTLNATANGLSANITQVSNDLSNLSIGGRNYVQKSLDEIEVTNALTRETTYSYPKIKLEPNTEYTFSLEYSASSNTTSVDLFFVSDVGEHRSFNNLPQTNGVFVYKSFTFTTGSNPNQSGNPRIDNNGNTGGTSVVRARKVKIEKGNKATDWTPAPEDMATLEKVTSIEANVNGLQTTVASKAEKSQITQLSTQISTKVESATYNSKMTQLDSAINVRVTKGDVTAQINVEAGVTLISNKKLLLDANTYIMGTTFANDIKAKSLEAVYADIATLKTKMLTADVITSTMVKSDLALIDKIFVSDANVNRLTAKTAFINSVKAVDIAADRITSGTFNGAKMNVINIDASAISANTLASLTSNTGTLNVTGYVNILNSDTGIYGKFNYGGVQGESYNPRWFDGNWRLGTNLLRFQADAYNLTSTNGKGTRIAYYETQYGSDFIALRKYNSSTNMTLQSRVDIQSDMIQIADNWNDVNAGVILRSNGTISASGITARANLTVGTNLDVTGSSVLRSTLDVAGGTILRSSLDVQGNLISRTTARFEGVITATSGMSLSGNLTVGSQVDITGASIIRSTLDVQGSLTTRSTARFEGATKITSTLSVDGQVQATNIYNNTQSQSANVWVSSYGYLFRATSASKYKLNIEPLENELDYAKKVLQLQPKKWHDKHAVEMYASYLTAKEKGVISTVNQDELLKITKSVGLIAEDLEQVGLTDFVTKSEKTGEIEGIEYSMLHVLYIPLIKDLYRQIEQQNKTIMELERKIA